ncbi:Os11g0538100 [Oryza sativa Japonica Group]|uniref:Os11g0538100 protein n=3 Tax=Oryza TaxID=4527 RepID=Q2R347_ORYSJ|nr:hypothetical protein LOC_Os11g33160 [Oryza sativa Japonica Group]EAZ18616.1 hypothetical protein OsJ_34137 [Oryza sativa Japonica Group]BAT14315.1 Os11g0538100 [Oryza sativa Japonica Group]
MNATVASPSEPAAAVTVASLDELREVAEDDPRASEDGGLRVAVTGVPVSQAEELHALVRDHVEAKLWSVGVGDEADAAMAALRSAADGAARLVGLSRALDAVAAGHGGRSPGAGHGAPRHAAEGAIVAIDLLPSASIHYRAKPRHQPPSLILLYRQRAHADLN